MQKCYAMKPLGPRSPLNLAVVYGRYNFDVDTQECSLVPRLLRGKVEPGTHCLCMCKNLWKRVAVYMYRKRKN